MTWHELRLGAVPRTRMAGLTDLLMELGSSGLQESGPPGVPPELRQPWDDRPPPPPPAEVWVRAWFEDPERERLEARLHQWWSAAEPVWAVVEEEDWEQSWKDAFPRLQIASDLALCPPWLAEPGDLVVEPGQGFGTGHHPSTRAILEAVWAHAPSARTMLDVGCGSGVLALAAAKRGNIATGIDIDIDALANARHNASLNGLEASFSTTPLDQLRQTWDLVAANLYAELLVPMSADLVRVTGSRLLLAGILTDKAPAVRAAFDPLMGPPDEDVRGPWTALSYRKRP